MDVYEAIQCGAVPRHPRVATGKTYGLQKITMLNVATANSGSKRAMKRISRRVREDHAMRNDLNVRTAS